MIVKRAFARHPPTSGLAAASLRCGSVVKVYVQASGLDGASTAPSTRSKHPPPRRSEDAGRKPFHTVPGVQQESGAGLPAVLVAKRAQVFRVALPRPCRGLDL